MKISFECPMCHNSLEGESEWCGQKAQCPYCQNEFVIPESTPDNNTTAPLETPPPPPAQKRHRKRLYISLATFFMLCVLAISSVVLAYVIPPKSNKVGESTGKKFANINAARGKQQTKADNSAGDVPSQTKTSTRNTISKSSNNQHQVKQPAKKPISNPATKSVALKKSHPTVEKPKKRDYFANMGFEKLATTLSDFRNCRCDDCHKNFSSFFNGNNWEIDRSLSTQYVVFVPKYISNQNLSYRQKKQIILQNEKNVIDYLNELYNTPISQLQDKYMNEKCIKYQERRGTVRIFSPGQRYPVPECLWHTKFLAERGCVKAQLAVGFNCGYFLDVDAIKWTKKAANNGDAKACFLLGEVCCDQGSDWIERRIKNVELMKTGIDWLKKGAALGDADCMYELGYIMMRYLSDGNLALRWFRMAAQKNHADAIYKCAQIYGGGRILEEGIMLENVKTNYRLAVKYYEQLIEMYKNDKNFENIIDSCKNEVENLKLKIED